ncbi:MAG: response regulator [Candidatus Eisenbacteria sp.]|nr:response regulator [Candidatus Eisenbacteria bacterium]
MRDWGAPAGNPVRLYLADADASLAAQIREWAGAAPGAFSLEAFPSNRQLLRRVEFECPDAVLLDVTMPRLDGLTALRALRSTGVPVVMLSPNTIEGARAAIEALVAGAADCFLKKRHHRQPRLAMTGPQFVRRIRRAIVEHDADSPSRAQTTWRSIEVDDRGRVVAGRPHPVPFPRRESWVGLAWTPMRSLGRLVRSLAAAPERPPGGMLLGACLPQRYTRALAEGAARHWNRVVLELQAGESLRPGQWRVIPGRHHVRMTGNGSAGAHLALENNRLAEEESALARQLALLDGAAASQLRLYLYEQPTGQSGQVLHRLLEAGCTVLLHGEAAATLRFELEEKHADQDYCGKHGRSAA